MCDGQGMGWSGASPHTVLHAQAGASHPSPIHSEAYPHLIFDGFSSALGKRLANVLKHLFPVPKDDSEWPLAHLRVPLLQQMRKLAPVAGGVIGACLAQQAAKRPDFFITQMQQASAW